MRPGPSAIIGTIFVILIGGCATAGMRANTNPTSSQYAPVVLGDPEELAPGPWLEGDPITFFGTGSVEDGKLYLTSPNGTRRRVLDATSSWTGILDQMSPIIDGIQASVKAWPSRNDPNTLLASEVLPFERSSAFVMGRARVDSDGKVVLRVQNREVTIDDEDLANRIRPFTPEVSPGAYNAGAGFIVTGNIEQVGDRRVLRGEPAKVWLLTAPNGYATAEAVQVGDYMVVKADVPNGDGKVLTYSRSIPPAEINEHDIGYERDRARAMNLGMPRFAEEVPDAIRAQFPDATRFFEIDRMLWTQKASLRASGASPNTNIVIPGAAGSVCSADGTDPVACLLNGLPAAEEEPSGN